MNTDIAKIIDFLYSEPSIPEDLLMQIQSWMKHNEHNQEVTSALLNLWDEEYGKNAGEINPQAVERLLSEVERVRVENGERPLSYKPKWKRLIRYAASLVAIILVGISCYMAGSGSAGQETMLITAQGSAGSFILPDGTSVRLNSDSRLTYDADNFTKDGKRKVKIEGEAFFDVTKDENHPFVVEMSDMEVQVLGTSFEVRDYAFSGLKEVVLLNGKVEVTTPGNAKPSTLNPDQRLVYNTATGKCNVESTSAETYCRWIYPKLKLENEPLGDILITIGRKYSVDLSISTGVDTSARLSLTLANDDLEDIMSILSYLTDIDYRITDNKLSVYPLP